MSYSRFAENVSLIFLCYQFLLDRSKADDYNSPFPRVILETMTLFTSLTDAKLEKTHLVKVLPRYVKKGDAKTQFYAKRVLANATAGSREQKAEAPAKKPATKGANTPSPMSKRNEPEPVAGIKRSASTAGDGGAQKKVATTSTKTSGASAAAKQNGVVKKATPSTESTKLSTSATTGVKPKQVVAKPSGLFSSLQSAGKKPGTSNASKAGQPSSATATSKPPEKTNTTATSVGQNAAPKSTFSFAETMANLSKPKEEKPAPRQEKVQSPPETPEQKAKRLRKEARRNLHVSFKSGDELVQVRVFHHDPNEELGHDASQMRDVADVGGEGRMFKQQHQMMDVDEDEEVAEEDEKLIEFVSPKEIDFSVVATKEREQNYAQFGGGKRELVSAERAVRDHYEANNLIVFYTDANDIPPNPREPSNPYNGEKVDSVKMFGSPDEKYVARAKQIKGSHLQWYNQPQQPAMQDDPTSPFDFTNLNKYMNSPNNQPTYQQSNFQQAPTQPPPVDNDAIKSILASLRQAAPNQATPPPPAMGGYGPGYSAAPPNSNLFQTHIPVAPPSGQIDIEAILAQVRGDQPGAGQAPPIGGFGLGASGAGPSTMSYPQTGHTTTFENPERKRWREAAADNNLSWVNRQNPAYNPYYRTKVCKYWQEGRCQKGEECTYKHEED